MGQAQVPRQSPQCFPEAPQRCHPRRVTAQLALKALIYIYVCWSAVRVHAMTGVFVGVKCMRREAKQKKLRASSSRTERRKDAWGI